MLDAQTTTRHDLAHHRRPSPAIGMQIESATLLVPPQSIFEKFVIGFLLVLLVQANREIKRRKICFKFMEKVCGGNWIGKLWFSFFLFDWLPWNGKTFPNDTNHDCQVSSETCCVGWCSVVRQAWNCFVVSRQIKMLLSTSANGRLRESRVDH